MSRKPVPKLRSGRGFSWILFAIFIGSAVAVATLLEYRDFRQGRYSFLFKRIFRFERALSQVDPFQKELQDLFRQEGTAADFLQDRYKTYHFRISIGNAALPGLLDQIQKRVQKWGGRLELTDSSSRSNPPLFLYQIAFDRRVTHLLLISALPDEAPEPAAKTTPLPAKVKRQGPPRLALIIDDIGYVADAAEQIRDLGIPITAAVLPGTPFGRAQADLLEATGLEVIIHLPMQSLNGQHGDQEEGFITSRSTPEQIRLLIRQAHEGFPEARGANNHMGSLITSDRKLITPVLEAIRAEGLFFIDSRTSDKSLAYDLAREMGIATAKRDVFLDSTPDYAFSVGQIERLAALARKNGSALGIGHPFATTFQVLRDSVGWLKEQGLEIVFASALVE